MRPFSLVPRLVCFAVMISSLYSLSLPASANPFNFKGQASTWLAFNDAPSLTLGFGLRYTPIFSWTRPLSSRLTLDAEASADAYAAASSSANVEEATEMRLNLYRAWVRLSTARFEARLGLQKINFGSASLLRPLMWFDRVDPRDPLQMTEGVRGLLVRYFFRGNANAWAWALYGNDENKGWEESPTAKRTVEFGGRIQAPLFKGELGLTFHRRRADLGRGIISAGVSLADPVAPEERWAIDGKWDIGIGIWTEAVMVHQHHAGHPYPFQRFFTIGADTTLAVGNGLHLTVEHLNLSTAPGFWESGQAGNFTALTASLPLGLFDNLSVMVFYDWSSRNLFHFLNWQRTFDWWQFFAIAFWNPESGGISPNTLGINAFAGKGFRLMLVINH